MDALASIGEEGRVTCDNPRELDKSVDPGISEWGNPGSCIDCHCNLNT